jgi:hypothetical protein
MTEKVCRKCKQTKSVIEFSRNKATPDSLEYKCKSCKKKYNEENRFAISVQRSTYDETHKEQHYDNDAVTRARREDALCTEHTICQTISRRSIWGRDEGCCRIKLACTGEFLPFENMTVDHIIPYSKNGKHCWYNVQTSCRPCNSVKYDKVV